MEVEQLNRRNARRSRPAVEPIYRMADAQAAIGQFAAVDYDTWFEPLPGIRARFWNAGHLLGSASIEVEAKDGDATVRLLFSADIGPDYKLLHPDPTGPSDLDYVLCESTYGDRDRIDATAANRRIVLRDEVRAAINPQALLIRPRGRAGAGRSTTSSACAGGELEIPIFVDRRSRQATGPPSRRRPRVRRRSPSAASARGTGFTQTVDESKALDRREASIVIAASGMCEAASAASRTGSFARKRPCCSASAGHARPTPSDGARGPHQASR
jgi:metallo-beta-lactamase family protein